MSYQTGTALHVDDLLSQLSTFLSSNGWTIDKTVAGSGDGHSSELYVSKGSSYFSMKADVVVGNQYYHGVLSTAVEDEHLRVWGNTGFNGGLAVDAQPGNHNATNQGAWINFLLPNMTAYHFFTDPTKTYCHVVVETTANEFRHIIFGLCNKLGAYDGGEYVMSHKHDQNPSRIDVPNDSLASVYPFRGGGSSSLYKNVFRYNIDGVEWKIGFFQTPFSSWWIPCQFSINAATPLEFIFGSASSFADNISCPNDYNGLAPFISIPVGWMIRSSTSYLPAGHFWDVRLVNIENIVPGATLTLGSDEWLVFPFTEKKAPDVRDDLPNTGYAGIAYKKIP